MSGDLILAIFGLVVVLAMIFGLGWIMKRLGLAGGDFGKNKDSSIEIIESRLLDGRNRLYHIRWHGSDYLFSASATGVTKIGKQKLQADDFSDMLEQTNSAPPNTSTD